MNTSETLFLHLLIWSGISSIIIFEIQNRLVLLKSKCLNVSDQVLIVRLMCTILMELNCLQDYELVQVICLNTNLDTIFTQI